ncbi:MAG: GDSL-type esterase/lipase family protein [Victivallales bacterium]
MSIRRFLLFLPIAILAGSTVCAGENEIGADLKTVFARASAGAPIRAVAIGGSITQSGGGWIESWLKKTFPSSTVVMRNTGMSATGSALGMFRLERDVIAAQPDLVLIEYAVNDGGPEDDIIWTVESCVRRLKSLPHPPAIVMLEAANRQRPVDTVPPQRKVADHYGLVSIDLNAAVQAKIQKDNLKWEDLLSDNVHMNKNGNAFYSEQISSVLEKFLGGKSDGAAKPLPPQLSKYPLIMDGTLSSVPLAEGWSKEHSVPGWWDMFFLGATSCRTGGKVLEIPFRGTVIGIFYALDESYGAMYAGVDGAKPELLVCNNRKGYTYSILGKDLSLGEHILRIVVPEDGIGTEGVKLGYIMTGGDANAVKSVKTPMGKYDAAKLATLTVGAVPSIKWVWTGPFGDVSKPWPADDKTLPNLSAVFWPETNFENGVPSKNSPDGGGTWKKIEKNSQAVNFSTLTGLNDRGVCYAWSAIESDTPVNLDCELSIDYWGKIWVDGKLAVEISEHSGGPVKPIPIQLPLKAGKNNVLVKVHSGSLGCMFSLRIPECPSTIRFINPIETDRN